MNHKLIAKAAWSNLAITHISFACIQANEKSPHPHRQQRHNLLDHQACLLTQRGIIVIGDRVVDHRERIILQSIHRAHRLRGAREAVGDDGYGGDAEALRFYRVVQTAR